MNFPRAAVHDDTMNTSHAAETGSFIGAEDTEHTGTYATWRGKAGRVYATIFRSRTRKRGVVIPDTADNTTSGSPSPSSSSNTPPNDSNNTSTRPPRRRRYIDVWITKDSTSTSSGSRRGIRHAYRAALKDKVVRKHLTICTVSGILLLSMIPLYSIYAAHSNTLNGQTYHIFFLLLIMVFAIIFCHSLARTSLLATSIARHGTTNNTSGFSSSFRRIPSVAGPLGYAQPAQPIHVVLARDEEIALDSAPGEETTNNNTTTSATTKLAAPPPAYGLWRNSVRINPNLLYWQRVDNTNTNTTTPPTIHEESGNNNTSQPEPSNQHQPTPNTNANANTTSNTPLNTTASTSTQNRPPSYASEDGVEYVVEAQPRSTVTHYRVNV